MDLEDYMKNGLRVTNFRNGDDYTMSYPFPILSGFVTHPDGQSVKELVVTGEDNVDTVGKQENFRATWRVVNRCFRGVVRLNLGKNDFVLLAQIPSPPGLSEVVLRITVCFEPVENPERFVLPVYIVCSDSLGSFQSENDEDGSLESAVRRISTGAGLLQSATAEILFQEGFSKKTFHLLLNEQGLPRCEIFRTRLKMAEMYEKADEKLWKCLQAELREAFPAYRKNCKFLSFLAATRFYLPDLEELPYRYEDILKFVKGHVALGGSSLALCGTGCLYTWPESVEDLPRRLLDERPVDRRRFMDDSAYRGTRWACFSTTLGAACHELGHTFDLGHQPEGIMARGFDDIFTVFTSARPASLLYPADNSQSIIPITQNQTLTKKNSELQADSPAKIDEEVPRPPTKTPVNFKVVETSLGNYKRQREYIYSTNTMEPATVAADRKERTSLAAKMSGKLFSSSKKKDFRNEEVVVVTKRVSLAMESTFPDVDTCSSIPSSCAISLFEPENSQAGGDSCSVSTRPSSITSTMKKSRAWHKRLSIGAECEQFSQNTAKIDTKTIPAQNGSSKTVIKKHYGSYAVSSSAGLPIGEHQGSRPQSGFSVESASLYPSVNQFNQKEQKQILTKEEKSSSEKPHKSPWSRLFLAKKKKERLAEFSEVEEQKILSTHPTSISDAEDTSPTTLTTHQPPSLQAGVVANSEAVNRHSTEEVASKTGSQAVSDPVEEAAASSQNSVTVLTSESDEPCSPDSLEEEFRFKFDKKKPQKYIAAAISQDLLGEIRLVAPPKTASPPAVDGGLESGGSSSTPEPDDMQVVLPKSRQQEGVAKPQPLERNRRSKKTEETTAAPSAQNSAKTPAEKEVRKPRRAEDILARTNKEQSEKGVHFGGQSEDQDLVQFKESHRNGSEDNPPSRGILLKIPKKSEQKLKNLPKTDSPVNKKLRSQDFSRGVSMENVMDPKNQRTLSPEEKPMKEAFIIGLADFRGTAPTPQAFHYPVNDIHLTLWNEKAEVETSSVKAEGVNSGLQEDGQVRARVDLCVAPASNRTNGKSHDFPGVMTGTGSIKSGVSKLRFPLRTMQSWNKSQGKEEERPLSVGRSSVLNFIPTRSTLSSRNKENKIKSEDSQTKVKTEKSKSLPGSVVRRKSFGRKSFGRNSSRKKRNSKEDAAGNILRKEKAPPAVRASTLHLATAAPSQRLDFKHINETSGMHAYPAHKRSASRDSIGHLGTFLTTDADFEEGKDSESQPDNVDDVVAAAGDVGNRSTLPRKQHCSSLINTPSGISVMEEVNTPHRLPLPVAPPSSPSESVILHAVIGPKWTKNCASLLNYHKWFNPHIPADPQTPPQLDGYTLSASGGLRLIELRDVYGNVLQHWEYLEGLHSAPGTFPLPLAPGSGEKSEKTVVVAIDVYGNMIHRTLRGKFTGLTDT